MTPPPAHTESNAWLLLKHAAQLGLVASVAYFVLRGGDMPALTLSVAAAAIIGLVIVAMLDRQRFQVSGYEHPAYRVLDVVGPGMWTSAPVASPVAASAAWHAPQSHVPMVAGVASITGLAPLVADMSLALREPVDVT